MKNLPKFNKGEWAELLVLIKIILQQNIVLYNEKLQTTNKIFEVLSIHSKQNVIIQLYDNILTIRVNDVITVMEKIVNLVTPSDYELLFNEIFNNKDKTFTPANIPVNIQNKLLQFIDLKTSSTIKSDILLDVKNIDILEQKLTSGFSIKSYIGGLPTLLNASSGTNFIYKVVGDTKNLSELVINSIDTKSKIRDRINRIDSLGLKLEFYKTEKMKCSII